MNRLIKTTAIAAITVISLIGTGAGANADVAVNNGVGFVGKGDVQNALGYKNDAAIQQAVANGEITFSGGAATAERINVDYPMKCLNLATGDMSTVGHRLIIQPGTVSSSVTAVARVNGQGKFTNGWDLKGQTAGAFTASGNAFIRDTGCEGGALFMNTGTPSQPNTVTVTGSGNGLYVSGNGRTVALPNTPVEVPAP